MAWSLSAPAKAKAASHLFYNNYSYGFSKILSNYLKYCVKAKQHPFLCHPSVAADFYRRYYYRFGQVASLKGFLSLLSPKHHYVFSGGSDENRQPLVKHEVFRDMLDVLECLDEGWWNLE